VDFAMNISNTFSILHAFPQAHNHGGLVAPPPPPPPSWFPLLSPLDFVYD